MDWGILHVLIVLWFIFEWILRIIALFVVPRNRRPNSGMSWLLFIFLLPEIGWIAFLIFGSTKLPKNRRDAQKTLDHLVVRTMDYIVKNWQEAARLVTATAPKKYENSVRLAQGLAHLPVFAGNTVIPHVDYDETIKKITHDVEGATVFVHIEYYILALDKVTEPLFVAMATAAKRGVNVRVLYDAYGSYKHPRRREMLARMKRDGIDVHAMLPLRLPGKKYTRPDLRNHRKLVVVDGHIGYTGSLNMIQRDYHRKDDIVYDEMVVRLEGPVVLQLEAIFLNDWHAETGRILEEPQRDIESQLAPRGDMMAHVVPSGPGYDYENNLKIFNSLIHAAREKVTIVNPYFVPDQSLISAITSAARRGVTVTLVNSEAIDQLMVAHAQRSYYEEMLRAGVKIYLYKKPTLLHSKYGIIDDDACFIGSSNMDIRSFELNQELTLIVYDKVFTQYMQKATNAYLAKSKVLSKKAWLARPPRKQLLDNLARLTSSLQ